MSRNKLCAGAALLALALSMAGCGLGNPTAGITGGVGKARAARAVSSLQQALITASVVAGDSGGAGGAALATELQSRDPSNRYTTALPTEPGTIQVVGGGGEPLMLVTSAAGSGGGAAYVAALQEGSSTLWYTGDRAPLYTTGQPTQPGWSATPPQ
jgi:hypothetical protein